MRRTKLFGAGLALAVLVGTGAAVGHAAPAGSVACRPTITIGPAQAVEGNEIRFAVTMSARPGCALEGSVRYETVCIDGDNQPAGLETDYLSASGELKWYPGGLTTRFIRVTTLHNPTVEPDRSFGVRLRDATGANLGADLAVGTIHDGNQAATSILDGEACPATVCVTLNPDSSTPDCTNCQPGQRCTFTVGLSEANRQPVTVGYLTIDGTARAGLDFAGVRDGRLTIPPGATRATFTIEIFAKPPGAPVKTFQVALTSTSVGMIDHGRVEAHIVSRT
jgi:hypothetical protein